MAVPTADYLSAADQLLGRLERDLALSKEELEPLRKDLVSKSRNDAGRAIGGMKTAKVGNARIVMPTSENFKRLGVATERTKERFTNFQLQYLDKKDVQKAIREARRAEKKLRERIKDPVERDRLLQKQRRDRVRQQKDFVKYSNRLASNARDFLAEIQELEPTLQEEVQETLRQIDDAENDLLKLGVKSFTDLNERLRRTTNGRIARGPAQESVRAFDVNRNLWNLSLLGHPPATTRAMLANASERMAERVTTKRSLIPKNAFVFVGAGPETVGKMTKGSRVAGSLWKVIPQAELSRRFAKLNKAGKKGTHRDLGTGFNTDEFYIPVPPENLDEVKDEMKKRRKKFLKGFD